MAATPDVRTGQGDVKLSREEFERRLRERFYDRSSTRRRWRSATSSMRRGRPTTSITRARACGRPAPGSPIRCSRCPSNGSTRATAFTPQSGSTAIPRGGPASCWWRAQLAREEIERSQFTCDLLDLSLLTAQYGRQILPCKACVSTAMPLCHWPCSCYPNHAMGQVNDWMKRDLSHVGGGPRHHDCHACLLVPGAQRSQN